MHQELFRTTMDRLGLDTTYGAYVDAVPAVTPATHNIMSLFGVHPRARRGPPRPAPRRRETAAPPRGRSPTRRR